MCLGLAAFLGACGKKGPPLAPIVHVPAAVEKMAVQRIGHDLYVSLTIPTQNIDASTPADVSRVDLYAVTSATPPPRARFLELASQVAGIDVQPPPRDMPAETAPGQNADEPLPAQGATVTVRDTLAPADLVPVAIGPPPAPGATAAGAAADVPRRYYMAVARSDRGRQGPPGIVADVALWPLPDPPGPPTFTYTRDAVTVSWAPPGAGIDPAAGRDPSVSSPGAPPSPDVPAGPTSYAYNVYRELPDGQDASAAPVPWNVVPPQPLNPSPVSGLMYVDAADMQLDRERCYLVRAVTGTAPNLVTGPPSARVCMVPEDVFAPEAPTGLSAIAAEGVISLLWEPNGEEDLAGYLILRGRAGDATLQPITRTPVSDTSYPDRDVLPGVRYVYAVQAVDTHQPEPNVSGESNRVEETAR